MVQVADRAELQAVADDAAVRLRAAIEALSQGEESKPVLLADFARHIALRLSSAKIRETSAAVTRLVTGSGCAPERTAQAERVVLPAAGQARRGAARRSPW